MEHTLHHRDVYRATYIFPQLLYQLRGMASTLRMRTTISTPAVVAMDSSFALIRTNQHGIATGEMSHIRSSSSAGYYRGECKSISFSLFRLSYSGDEA